MKIFILSNSIQPIPMDNILFEHFPPISAKQWKQKIQYLLQGEDYQKLIHINTDGVSTLPFYTKDDLNQIIPSKKATVSKATFYCIVTKEVKANNEALKAIEQGIESIYFAVFDPNIDLNTLLRNIDCEILFQCYFLNANFSNQSILKKKKSIVLNDCLGKLSKTGNWYFSAKEDFNTLKNCISNTRNALHINLSIFHNAGATPVQQLSYAITQLMAYCKKGVLNTESQITYTLSVSTNLYIEVAKIQALRILHDIVSETIAINPNCQLIQHKSKRNLSGLFHKINEVNTHTEKQIAILGGVDYYLSPPTNFSFYKEDISTTEKIAKELKNSQSKVSPSIIKGSIYVEKLTQQLVEKSLLLIATINEGGGYVEQLKKGTIQQKVSFNETVETKRFIAEANNNNYEHINFTHKTPIAYPFLKVKKRKALWQPIIEKQLRESIERPIWEKHFDN